MDESHHARSELNLDMLKDFSPCFVLELTATPKKISNILSYMDAAQLKAANMVKRSVIVYSRDSQQEVITDAIDLRRNLERLAEAERSKSGVPFPKNRTQKREKTNEYPHLKHQKRSGKQSNPEATIPKWNEGTTDYKKPQYIHRYNFGLEFLSRSALGVSVQTSNN